MTKYSSILDYLCSVLDAIPATINSKEVTFIYEAPNGRKFGVNNQIAQGIQIAADKVSGGFGGTLTPVPFNSENYIILC